LLRDLAGQAARALGPQIRLHGRNATKLGKAASLDQDEAGYVDHPVNGEQCSGCTMFRHPASCSLVKGEIAADGHCEYFDAATDPLVPLTGTFPGTDDDEAARQRHNGLLATAALILAGAPIGDWQILRVPAAEELEETFAGSARGTLKLLGFDGSDTTVNQAREQSTWRRITAAVVELANNVPPGPVH
jgi:hypothetical protein